MNVLAPYDGSGYGQSIYWRKQMKEIAKEKGEECKCWDENEPILNFKGEESFEMLIECQEKKEDCVKQFDLTQAELLARFKNFHKV